MIFPEEPDTDYLAAERKQPVFGSCMPLPDMI